MPCTSATWCLIAKFHQVYREGTHFVRGTQSVKVFGNAIVYLYDQAYAEVHDRAVVHALCRSRVKLFNRASCHASDGACVMAFHNSSVTAGDWVTVKLFHRSVAELFGHASAKTYHRSRLSLHSWSTVETMGKSRIENDFRESSPDPYYLPALPPRPPKRVNATKCRIARSARRHPVSRFFW